MLFMSSWNWLNFSILFLGMAKKGLEMHSSRMVEYNARDTISLVIYTINVPKIVYCGKVEHEWTTFPYVCFSFFVKWRENVRGGGLCCDFPSKFSSMEIVATHKISHPVEN